VSKSRQVTAAGFPEPTWLDHPVHSPNIPRTPPPAPIAQIVPPGIDRIVVVTRIELVTLTSKTESCGIVPKPKTECHSGGSFRKLRRVSLSPGAGPLAPDG